MKITESKLRKITRDAINEISDKGPHTRGPGIVLSRLGGLSSLRQDDAPTRRGVWAFIWPYFEPFLVGSTDHRGIVGDGGKSRYELMKLNRGEDPSLSLRKSRYIGNLWTRLPVPQFEDEVEGWRLVDADSLREYAFGKLRADEFSAQMRREKSQGNFAKVPPRREDMPRMSKDSFEVFVPAGGGKFVGKSEPKNSPADPGVSDDLIESLVINKLASRILREAAIEPEDLAYKDVSVHVEKTSSGKITVEFIKKEDPDDPYAKSRKSIGGAPLPKETLGIIVIRKPKYDYECGDTYEVQWSDAKKGWGPLLYDIAMEVASLEGKQIMSDRDSVSDSAQGVWDYYNTKRPDVKKTQLDNEWGILTPKNKRDDCVQYTARKDAANRTDDPNGWIGSSLSKAYTKDGTPILDKLKGLGILVSNFIPVK
jgi:hypothetical protein